MTRKIGILIILVLVIISLATVTSATDINMNLVPNEVDNSTITGNEIDNEMPTDDTNQIVTDDIGGIAAPSGVSSIAQENMSFSNILNILIITVGVVLILLAIAILIRLK